LTTSGTSNTAIHIELTLLNPDTSKYHYYTLKTSTSAQTQNYIIMKILFKQVVFLNILFVETSWSFHTPSPVTSHHKCLGFHHGNNGVLKLSANDEVEKLQQQAMKMKLEAEKMEAVLTLEKISKLEKKLASLDDVEDDPVEEAKRLKRKQEIKQNIQILAKNTADPMLYDSLPLGDLEDMNGSKSNESSSKMASSSSGTTNLYKDRNDAAQKVETNLYKNQTFKKMVSEEDLQKGTEYYVSLPKPMRKALAKAIDLDDDLANPSVVVLGLYELSDDDSLLNPKKLQQIYKNQLLIKATDSYTNNMNASTLDKAKAMLSEKGFDGQPNDQDKLETMIETFLPRVTRKEGKEPTDADVSLLKTVILNKDTFQISAQPLKVPGGYILRGEMAAKLGGDIDQLVKVIDETIDAKAPEWNTNFQVSVMNDPTPELFDNNNSFDGETVLVVHSRDMEPSTSRILLGGVSFVSLFLAFIFSIAIYSQNDVVMERLTSANAVGEYDVTWFNELITPLLVSVGFTQACHEAAHLFIARKDGFKITSPTIMPLIALPYMSFQQNLKTSPKNFDSLFNFGMIGPAVGMVVSSAFFWIGLQLTLDMDASALEYAPSVPVLFLKLSTLGGSIVDNVIGGSQGIITQQDPLTPVKLHPFAIGGLASLMINCLDTIPISGTDGGRMSQSLLGRQGQVAFGGVVYFGLLVYTIFSGNRDIFLTFLLVNSFSRQDSEIPCRNEIDRASLGQAATALVMWCVAILTLTPLN